MTRKPKPLPSLREKFESAATLLFVAGVATLGGVVWAFSVVDNWYWRGFILLAAAVEAWALANSVPSDTISERIWSLNRRPLVPYFQGLALGFVLAKEWLPLPVAVAAAFISAHFVWQQQGVYDTLAIEAFSNKHGKTAAGKVVKGANPRGAK